VDLIPLRDVNRVKDKNENVIEEENAMPFHLGFSTTT
jgi:hypothetical protein